MAEIDPADSQPLFNDIPTEVLVLGGAITVVSVLILIAPAPISNWLFSTAAVLSGPGADKLEQPLGRIAPYALHVFAHAGWAHLGLNLAALAAFGTGVARRLAQPALFLGLFFICAVAGAAAEALVFTDRPTTMVGASSGIFGLIGAAIYIMRARGGQLAPLFSRTFAVGLAPWVLINVAIGVFGGVAPGVGQIAWVSHLGGLFAGIALFPLADRLRRRPL